MVFARRTGLALGIGLVGLGWHGERYAQHLARGDVPGLALAAVSRRDRAAGEKRARELGCGFHDSVAALAADPRVDALVIVSPGGDHPEHVRAGLLAGRPVLVEKPLAHSAREAWALVRDARARGARVMVAHTLRWEPVYETLARIAPAEIGDVASVNVVFKRSDIARRPSADFNRTDHHRGLFAVGIHFLDWASLLFPGGFVEARGTQPAAPRSDLRTKVRLRARSGGEVSVAIDLEAAESAESVRVVGDRGVLVGDRPGHTLVLEGAPDARPIALPKRAPSLASVLGDFRDFVRGERPNPVPLEVGARAVTRVDACVRALETGTPVLFSEEEDVGESRS